MPLALAPLLAPLLVASSVHYQMALAGVPVGRVRLGLERSATGWSLSYQSEGLVRRGPAVARLEVRATAELAPSGEVIRLESRRAEGGAEVASIFARADGDGALSIRVRRAGGETADLSSPRAYPSALAPLLLSPGRPCATVVEETTGRVGEACAQAFGDEVAGRVLGEPFRAQVRAGVIERLELSGQRASFLRVERPPELEPPPDLFGSGMDGAGPDGEAGAWTLFARERLELPSSASQSAAPSEKGAVVLWRRVAPVERESLAAQSPRDELGAAAARLTHGPVDAWAAAQALARAVSERIDVKLPAAGEGSPEQVWRTRRAGCRGHAELFLALARRAGLSARRALGLVAQDGRFYWHAWAQVRVGERWYDVDPTEGEAPARAPRILFAAGDAQVDALAPRLLGLAEALRISPLERKRVGGSPARDFE